MDRALAPSVQTNRRRRQWLLVGTLASQFLIETLLLTLLGGVAGLARAAAVLRGLGRGYLAAYGPISIDWSVFGWVLLGSLVFRLLSGAYSAYRMAKIPAIKVLKSAQV